MTTDPPDNQPDVDPGGRPPRGAYAVLLVGLTLLLSIAAVVFIHPHVGPWLELRTAYRNLSSDDSDKRIEAVRSLRRLGKNPASELIALLHHRDEGVRYFAAGELAHRNRVTNDVIEAFLTALETGEHVAEIGGSAPHLFFKHAKDATGPLTDSDRRMIDWLKTRMNSTDPQQAGNAAIALAAFMKRDPSLKQPLAAYLKDGPFSPNFNYKYSVLREMASSDPSLREPYIAFLLSSLTSSDPTDQRIALYGLTHLETEPDDLRSRLAALRENTTNAEVVSRIDEVLETLEDTTTDDP